MKNYEVFKRAANSDQKISLGVFITNSKKDVCAKLASFNQGWFISAKELK